MYSLDQIAKLYGTDKSSEIHNYCTYYEKYLPFDREDPIKILEIGVWNGNSLLTWKDYYPNSIVVGIDIMNQCLRYTNPSKNIWIEIGSQNDINFLRSVVDKWGSFDMILDDGSHMNEDVIISFNYLIDYVKNSGVYIVEDSCCSYWPEYNGGFRKESSSVEHFKRMIDDVNFNGQLRENFKLPHARREDYLINQSIRKNLNIRTDIESINFLNSLIIITKR
jgi:hypothetical protein